MNISPRNFLSKFLIVFIFGSAGCASLMVDSYLQDVDAMVRPVWHAQMNAALAREGLEKLPRPVASSVYVTVDAQGKILDVRIGKSSGLSYVNSAGTEAFRKLGKLPPPPRNMLSEGTAKLDWDFVVTE